MFVIGAHNISQTFIMSYDFIDKYENNKKLTWNSVNLTNKKITINWLETRWIGQVRLISCLVLCFFFWMAHTIAH